MSGKRIDDAPDRHALYEERLVLAYFSRKALGDFSAPVPDLISFEHVAAFSQPLMAMACERELRALFLNVGSPLSVEMCAELMEHVDVGGRAMSGEAAQLESEISDLEDEIESLGRERDALEDELNDLEINALNKNYVPADAFPLALQIERMGA